MISAHFIHNVEYISPAEMEHFSTFVCLSVCRMPLTYLELERLGKFMFNIEITHDMHKW